MIAVVVVTESDLNAEQTGGLVIEFCARLRRLIHRNGRERIAIVALLFERSRKRTTGQRQHGRKVSGVGDQSCETLLGFGGQTLIQQ